MYYRIFSGSYKKGARAMALECQDFIKKGSKILDLGCGSAIAGKYFQDFFGADVLGMDIKDDRIEKIPFQVYDGLHIPFPDHFFDIVLVAYVLHHCQDPIENLKEVKRVAKGKILIYEDLLEGLFSRVICKIHGFTFDQFVQKNKKRGNFKTEKEWKEVFKELNLRLVAEKIPSPNFPAKKKIFVLEKA